MPVRAMNHFHSPDRFMAKELKTDQINMALYKSSFPYELSMLPFEGFSFNS